MSELTLHEKYKKILQTKSHYDIVYDSVEDSNPILVIGKQKFNLNIDLDPEYKFTPEQASAIDDAYNRVKVYEEEEEKLVKFFRSDQIEHKINGFKVTKIKGSLNQNEILYPFKIVVTLTNADFIQRVSKNLVRLSKKGWKPIIAPRIYITYRDDIAYIEQINQASTTSAASPFRHKKSKQRRISSKSPQKRRNLKNKSKSKSKKRSQKPRR